MRCEGRNREGRRCKYNAPAGQTTCRYHVRTAAASSLESGGGGAVQGERYCFEGCAALLCGILITAIQDARQHKNEQRADQARAWLASAGMEWLIEAAPRCLNMTDGRLGLADATDPRSLAWTT